VSGREVTEVFGLQTILSFRWKVFRFLNWIPSAAAVSFRVGFGRGKH